MAAALSLLVTAACALLLIPREHGALFAAVAGALTLVGVLSQLRSAAGGAVLGIPRG